MTTVKVEKRKSKGRSRSRTPRTASYRNSVAAIQEWLKGPPALTPEEAELLDQIIMAAREGKVFPIPKPGVEDECSSGNNND